MGLRRKRTQTVQETVDSLADQNTERQFAAIDAADGFRKKLETNPEFAKSFGQALLARMAETHDSRIEESRAQADKYGTWFTDAHGRTPDEVHTARVGLFHDIMSLMADFQESHDQAMDQPMTPRQFVDELRKRIGDAIGEAYKAGNQATPYLLAWDGVYGAYYPDVGQVAAIDKMKEAGIHELPDGAVIRWPTE